MTLVRWIVPEAKEPSSTGPRDASATGAASGDRPLRIGLLDNTKDNAALLLSLIGERVRAEFKAETLVRRKGNATVGAPVEILDDLAKEADCVITAMAD